MKPENKQPNMKDDASPVSETPENIQTEMDDIIDLIASYTEQVSKINDVIVGTFIGLSQEDNYLVDHPLNRSGDLVIASATVALDASCIGREVSMIFDGGDLKRPIITGLMHIHEMLDIRVIEAREEIIIRCGKASIQMKKDGTIRINGTSIVSRASGNNDLKGGSINLN